MFQGSHPWSECGDSNPGPPAPKLLNKNFSTFSDALQPLLLYYGCSSQLLTPLFPQTPRLSVVKHVVKNRFLNTLVTGDRKRFLWFVGMTRTDDQSLQFAALYLGCGGCASPLCRDRRRRICIAIDKEYTQQPLHSPNSGGVLRESAPEVRKSICALRVKRC